MTYLRYGLWVAVLSCTSTWSQPPGTLAAVYRAGKVVEATARMDLLNAEALGRFDRAVAVLRVEVKHARGVLTAAGDKDVLATYAQAQRKLERAVTNLELWAAMQDQSGQVDTLMGAVPATRGGTDGKAQILGNLRTEGQQASTEMKLALATAATSLREGRESLTKAERAYLRLVPEAASDPPKPPQA